MTSQVRSTNGHVADTRSTTRWLPLAAVAGPAIFTIAWLVLGFISPGFTIWGATIEPYSPISASISGLGLGPTGPYMNTAFVVGGLLVIAGAVGVFTAIQGLDARTRRAGAALFALSGLGLALDGLFTLESMLLHLAGFVLGIGALVIGYLAVGRALRRLPDWRGIGTLTLVASPLTVALAVLYFATFSPTVDGAKVGVAGLTERILVLEAFAPLMALGWRASRRPA